MITKTKMLDAQERAAVMFRMAGVFITEEEKRRIEVVDFGLSALEREGALILTLVSTQRIAVKLLALFPLQTEPEHWHPAVGTDPGKEETIRVVWGSVYFYVAGASTLTEGFIPQGREDLYTLRNELKLKPGDQLTFQPGEKHWFQAGEEGVVLYSFSSTARDVLDAFTDPGIVRISKVVES
jgi:D-lyxose ketol-isomerase